MNRILDIITPVISEVEHTGLRNQLLTGFPKMEKEFAAIENAFRNMTAAPQGNELLNAFFHSWSQTNNSAMTVAGLSNRLTMMIHKKQAVPDEGALFRSVASLNRIVDEDLAVVGRVLHSQLFYTMATNITGDDNWLSRRYLHDYAKDFKAWKDHNSLREKDIMIGLLTTFVHEIYTHGEVEYILPLFSRWLDEDYGFEKHDRDFTLAWISVHCGPTEKNHFFHALHAIHHYAQAMNVDIDQYDLSEIISNYLNKKAAVMQAVMENQQTSIHS